MGRPIKDVNGERFGSLTILNDRYGRINNKLTCLCQCDCGTIFEHDRNTILNGDKTNCGCKRHTSLIDSKAFLLRKAEQSIREFMKNVRS